jgi:hypothetical protein
MCGVARAEEEDGGEVAGPSVAWGDAENEVSIDMSWFAQSDGGGNPAQREGVRYLGGRAFVKAKVLDELTLRGSVAVAKLEDGGTDEGLKNKASITNANLTQASKDQQPVTVNLYADIEPAETELKITPGVYFFDQSDFSAAGGSLDLSIELAGGDTTPFVGFEFRLGEIELDYWDGTKRGDDDQKTFSFLIGVTQVLSPKVVTSLSAQYVHQQGYLSDPVNRLALYNAGGTPILLIDERLPRRRDRVQVNGRIRYSLAVGWSLGLDASGYADSWSVSNGALEPSLETRFFDDIAVVRFWYRVVLQDATKYFRDEPIREYRYQTGDSDLGDFISHGVGVLISLKLPLRKLIPELHGSLFYYGRTDRVEGLQVSAGVTVRF